MTGTAGAERLRLTTPTGKVLRVLAEATGKVYGLGVCDAAGLGPGTVYPILARLEARGLIVRTAETTRHPGRPPRRYIELTDTGRALITSIKERANMPQNTDHGQDDAKDAEQLRDEPAETIQPAAEPDGAHREHHQLGAFTATATRIGIQLAVERDGAYRERNRLAAFIAARIGQDPVVAPALDVDEPGWQILYVVLDGRQCSWHLPPRDADLVASFEHVPADDPRAQWDGHTTDEKHQHIDNAITKEN